MSYRRKKKLRMAPALHVAAMSKDAVRKMTGLSASADGVICLIVSLMYVFLLRGSKSRIQSAPRHLFIWLTPPTFWLAAPGAWGRMRKLPATSRPELQTAERTSLSAHYTRPSMPQTHRG